jgi:hypothetical protein
MTALVFAEQSERDDLGAFVARAVRLDQQAVVRLRTRRDGPGRVGVDNLIDAWVSTPFDVLATRTVRGVVEPADLTVFGNELLAALTVARGDRLDPGPPRDMQWRSALPPELHWQVVDQLPARVVADLADRGLAVAKDNVGPTGTPPASLLDQSVLTVSGDGLEVKIPLRCLFAMSGMGFLGAEPADATVRVTATDSWLRIDARYGAVVRRRHALLPLLV